MDALEFYNTALSVYFSFKDHNRRKDDYYRHSELLRKKNMQGCSHLYSWSKSTLIVSCLIVNLRRKPKSIPTMFKFLVELDPSEIADFKEEIKNYKRYFIEDKNYIVENRIEEVQDLFNLFVQRKIKFFSLYYFIRKYNLEEEVLKSRIFSTIYTDIKTLMSFLNLKEISEV